MAYYINLEKISLGSYKEVLKHADLVPSRMLLKENTDSHFNALDNAGIQNLEELVSTTKTKKKLLAFASENNINTNYLTILVREIKSLRPKPTNIQDFPSIDSDTVQKLRQIGIKNTLHIYDRILTSQSRYNLSKESGVDENIIIKLGCLADLTRIRWVNHTFSYMLYEINYTTAKQVANTDYHKLHELIKILNNNRNFYKGTIGLHDFQLIVECAQDLDFDIDF